MVQCDGDGVVGHVKLAVPGVELLGDIKRLSGLQLWRNAHLGLACRIEPKSEDRYHHVLG